MTPDDVMAVVVSRNGGATLRATVDALRGQMSRVHVVDNGSTGASAGILAALEQLPGITVERLGENRGVGCALNRGVARARSEGRSWLLTMDQDSTVQPGLLPAFAAAIAEDPRRVCLAPLRIEEPARAGGPVREVRYAITSGNLVRMALFDKIGHYDEGFFIDCVDFDFCLRVRQRGHAIHHVPGAQLRHVVGERLPDGGVLSRFYQRHSPVRRYYMFRNYCYLAERYLVRFPGFILKLGALQALLAVLVGFRDPAPAASYRAIARGVRDYLARRVGPYPEPAR